jgi:hypothetical protein
MIQFENLKMEITMKTIFNTNRSLQFAACGLLLIALIALQSCGKKSDPTPPTEQTKAILKANTWNMATVTVDGTDRTSVYTGLTLSFTDTDYTTTNGRAVWPASGTWVFADPTGKVITRNDGLQITVEEAVAGSLKLKLTWNKTTLGGRAESVAGVHVFSFVK